MRIFIIFFIFIINFSAFAVSKKDSINQKMELVEKEIMQNAGSWELYMSKCDATFRTQFEKDLARFSWPDYRNYVKGKTNSGKWEVTRCVQSKTEDIRDWYNDIVDYISSEVGQANNFSNESKTKSNNNQSNTKLNTNSSNKTTKEQLRELKELFEEDLISKEDYEERKKKILDEM